MQLRQDMATKGAATKACPIRRRVLGGLHVERNTAVAFLVREIDDRVEDLLLRRAATPRLLEHVGLTGLYVTKKI